VSDTTYGNAGRHLRAGLRLSLATLAWTVATNGPALVLGVVRGSLVLAAFGLTGLLDAAGSATLAVHLRHALRHEAFSERHELIALRVVTVGLVAVGVTTAAESVHRLVSHPSAHRVPAGMAIAAVSAGVLAVLSHHKRRVGALIPSKALVADGWLSAVGAALAVVTVAGTALTIAYDTWWADPIAAFTVGVGAIVTAVVMTREEPS